jgi:hypothetical protein
MAADYLNLLTQLGVICKHHREISRISGVEFNIFKVVKIAEDEVRHSAFLAELLNPQGSHGQGEVFLKLFVEQIGMNEKEFGCISAVVESEKHIGNVTEDEGGRIDIFISDKKNHFILIENKIYADDQNFQLIRYYNFKNQYPYSKVSLFYLTLFGEKPTLKSKKNDKLMIELMEGIDYKLLSYKTDILPWLDKCQKETVNMPLLREGLTHYINLIKHLTGETINKTMSNEIIELLTKNQSNLKNAKELVKNWPKVKTSVQWKFWEELKKAMEEKGLVLEDIADTITEQSILNCYEKNFMTKYIRKGLYCRIYENDDLIIRGGCEVGHNVYHIFKIWFKKLQKNVNDNEYNIYRSLISECDVNYQFKSENPGCLGWKYTDPQLNFEQFNSDSIFSLADEPTLYTVVKNISETAKADISFLQEKLKENY